MTTSGCTSRASARAASPSAASKTSAPSNSRLIRHKSRIDRSSSATRTRRSRATCTPRLSPVDPKTHYARSHLDRATFETKKRPIDLLTAQSRRRNDLRSAHGARWEGNDNPYTGLSRPVRGSAIRQPHALPWVDEPRHLRPGLRRSGSGRAGLTKPRSTSSGEVRRPARLGARAPKRIGPQSDALPWTADGGCSPLTPRRSARALAICSIHRAVKRKTDIRGRNPDCCGHENGTRASFSGGTARRDCCDAGVEAWPVRRARLPSFSRRQPSPKSLSRW
jgi:hypothetical protein